MSFREISAFFIGDQCLFGAYPTQHQIHELEDWGVDLIVNLTSKYEKNIRTYSTSTRTINFIISDNKAPENILEFCALIIYITKQIDQNQKIYIHCKGGHGRSGVLVASILCYKFKITPHDAIKLTTKYHSTRPIHARRPKMNEYWKSKGSPQTKEQKQFVVSIFQPYVVTKDSPFNQKGMWIRGGTDYLCQYPSGRNLYEAWAAKLPLRSLEIDPEAQAAPLLNSADGLSGGALFQASCPYHLRLQQNCPSWPKAKSRHGSEASIIYHNYIDSFLLDTNLGPITGNNGPELEKYRDTLIKNLVFFP